MLINLLINIHGNSIRYLKGYWTANAEVHKLWYADPLRITVWFKGLAGRDLTVKYILVIHVSLNLLVPEPTFLMTGIFKKKKEQKK
jgi:hypothetical protein